MTRLSLVVGTCLVVAGLCGCATPQTGSNTDEPTQQTVPEIDAPERDLPYPEQTRLVVRIEPDRLPGLIRELERLRSVQKGSSTSMSDEGADSRVSMADVSIHLLTFGLLTGHFEVIRFGDVMEYRNRPKRSVRRGKSVREQISWVEGVDEERPVVIAVSSRHNERYFRGLRLGAPGFDYPDTPYGSSYRLFLPADDGEASSLAARIEEKCDAETMTCSGLARATTHDSWVVLDTTGEVARMRGFYRDRGMPIDAPQNWGESDADLFDRATPAVRSFFEGGDAVAVYGRHEDLTSLGALEKTTDIFAALEQTRPAETKEALARGYGLLVDFFQFDDPEVREYEDVALHFDVPDSERWDVRAVTTRTAHGATVAENAQPEVELPEIREENAVITVESAIDLGGAIDAARVPSIFDDAGRSNDRRSTVENLRRNGEWASLKILASYPMGAAKWLDATWSDTFADETGFQEVPGRHLHGFRAAIGMRTNDDSPMGLSPRGGIALLVGDNSELLPVVEKAEGRLESMLETDVTVETEPREESDRTLVTVAFGESEDRFGSATAVEQGLSGRIDAEKLPSMSETPENSGTRRRGPSMPVLLRRVLRTFGAVEVDSAHAERGAALRATTGATDDETRAEIPRSKTSLSDPSGRKDCLERAGAASRRRYRDLFDDGSFDVRTIDDLLETLASEAEDCSEGADAIDLLRAQWLRERAVRRAKVGRFASAAEDMEQSCELTDGSECPELERLRDASKNYRAPAPPQGPHGTFESAPYALRFVGRSRPFFDDELFFPEPNFLLKTLATEDGTTTESWFETLSRPESTEYEQRVSSIPTRPVQTQNGVASVAVVALDRSLGAGRLGPLLALAGRASVDERMRYEAEKRGDPVPPESVTGLALHVRSEGSPTLEVPFVVMRTSDADVPDEAPQIRLAVRPGGIAVSGPDEFGSIDIEACDASGPAICVKDGDRRDELVETIRSGDLDAGRESELADELAAQYRLASLSQRLGDWDAGDRAPVFDLSIESGVPVDLVARVAAAIGEYTRSTYDVSVPLIRVDTRSEEE